MEVKETKHYYYNLQFVFIVYPSHLQFFLSLQHFIYKWEQSLSPSHELFCNSFCHFCSFPPFPSPLHPRLVFNCIAAGALLFISKELGQQGPGSCKSTFQYLSGIVSSDNLSSDIIFSGENFPPQNYHHKVSVRQSSMVHI